MNEEKKRRTRSEMISETTAKLISAARKSFAINGYAATSMDALCAEVGLTRGALYHHFGGKEGLLEAVVKQIDQEITVRLDEIIAPIQDHWEAFRECCRAYLALSLQPEIQRIVLTDAPAVLGQKLREIDSQTSIVSMTESLRELMESGKVRQTDPEALARLLNGAMIDAALWIAASGSPDETLQKAQHCLDLILDGISALSVES